MPVLPSRVFRLFVSSTFIDLAEVRQALQSRVFPRLRDLCGRYGARFSPVDLRWGVSEEATQDRQTMAICLGEIRRCQETTPRPNFLILLGPRYGWRPLPAEITVDDFERLRSTESLRACQSAFEHLYPAVDSNAVPPAYCLRPATGAEDARWHQAEQNVLTALANASATVGWPDNKRAAFGGSATEQEIVCGLLDDAILPTARGHVHAFFTNAGGVQQPDEHHPRQPFDGHLPAAITLRSERARVRVGVGTNGAAVVGDGHISDDSTWHGDDAQRLELLKERLRHTLGANVHEYGPVLQSGGAPSPLALLCDQVYASLAGVIDAEAERITHLDPLDCEIDAHNTFARERSRIFIGRAAVLGAIAGYLAGEGGQVFALIGASGSGKSSAMARALRDARRQYPHATVVARFIGTTPESSSGITLLNSLAKEISRTNGIPAPTEYAEFPRMAAVFRETLMRSPPEQPLLLFLDALDQLQPFDAARNLTWLPLTDLPSNVRLVISVSADAHAMAAAFEAKLDSRRRAHLEPMPPEEAGQLLAVWLAEARRDLRPWQREALIDGFRRSGLPLYLRLAFEEGRLWRSFEKVGVLGDDVCALIGDMFSRLSDAANHGPTFVERSLSYLTAAKDGLTEEEIVDVLSADDEVMTDFRRRFPKSPASDRLPMVIWSRLYYDLKPYLSERGGAGSAVLNYFHGQMRQVATAEYLDENSEIERHRALAHYFRSKPNLLNATVYNGRRLSELPYQLRKAGMWHELEATLCDLSFIEAKCGAGLIYDLLSDYDAAMLTPGLPAEAKARIESFGRFVRAQAHLLSTHPHLTFQQALNEPDSTAPAQAAARLATVDTRPRFRRLGKSQQTSPCVLTLYGHTSYVNGCDVSPDNSRIASAGSDGAVKVWNAATGEEVATLRGPTISMECCHYSPDGQRLVAGTRSGLVIVWDLVSGRESWSVKVHDRPVPCCRFSHDGRRIVSASWDGRVKVLDADTGHEQLSLAGHDGDACWAEFSRDDTGLISVGGDGLLKQWRADTGDEIRAVKAHEHEIMTCRFSLDGTAIFTASQDMLVKRWDAATLELESTYDGHLAGVWAAAVSPDGMLLVSGAGDGSIKLWDADNGMEVASLKEHTNEVWGLTFVNDGSRFVSAAWDGTVKVWDLSIARRLADDASGWSQTPADAKRLWGYMIACCCAPDGSIVAAGSQDGSLRVWDASTGRVLGVHRLHNDFIMACGYSPDSRWIVSGAWDGVLKIFDVQRHTESDRESMSGTIVSCAFAPDGRRVVACSTNEVRVWDFNAGMLTSCIARHLEEGLVGCALLPSGNELIVGTATGRFFFWDLATRPTTRELPGHPGLIMFTLSRDGRLLAATSERGVVWVWDVQSRTELLTLEGHRERVIACSFSPDGARVVSGSWDAAARIWELDKPDKVTVLEGHTDQLQDCCFTPDGRRVLTASVDGSLRLWDARSGTALGELLSPADSASICAVSTDGTFVATASSRHGIRVWDGASGSPVRILSGHDEAVRASVFLPDGGLVSASTDGTVRLWDIDRGSSSVVETHDGPVRTCAVSPDGRWIASGGHDRVVKLWDVRSRSHVATLRGHDDWLSVVLFDQDGGAVVSGSIDGTVRVWDRSTTEVVHVLRGHDTAVSAAALSAEGARLVTGCEAGVLIVWDLDSGQRQQTLSGQRGAIRTCVFGRRIISTSRDGTLRLWDVATGDLVAELRGHTGGVQACALAPDGRHVVSASEDKFVKAWDLTTGEQRAEYWVGSPALSVSWAPGSYRVAVGDATGNLHLLDLEGSISMA
jgi:WD40 repeat protein